MDLPKIKALIALLHESELSALELTEGDATVRLERGSANPPAAKTRPAPPRVVEAMPAAPAASTGTLIKAPMQGILHLTPSPDEAPFVKVGDLVQAEQVICVIEAMKMFNTVEADDSGRIAEILVSSGSEVKAGQALFRLA